MDETERKDKIIIDTGRLKITVTVVTVPLLTVSAQTENAEKRCMYCFGCHSDFLYISSMTVRTFNTKLIAFVAAL